MTHPSRHRRRSKLRSWYVWHRWLGVSAALLVVVLAVTGIALNHTDALQLDRRVVSMPALLTLYGIDTPDHVITYPAGPGHTVSQVEERLYFDARPLEGTFGPLRGVAAVGPVLAAAAGGEIVLLTREGVLVERLGAVVPPPHTVERIGVDPQGRVVIAAQGRHWQADAQLLQWRPVAEPPAVRWAAPVATPQPLRETIIAEFRGSGLSLERVLLDLHSGRILGTWGIYLMDAAALALLLLAGSGTWLWARHRRRR